MKTNLVSEILKRVASRIGAKVELDPEYGFAGQVTYKSGRRRYFRASSLDLNPLGSSEIAKDKDYAAYFMKNMGYPAIPGKTFFSDEWCEVIGSNRNIDAAYTFAQDLGFPVVVKPNSKSQGQCVAMVFTKKEFYAAMRRVFKKDRVALVQKAVSGVDYRVVVLDGEVISAYERIPLSVTGDGDKSILELLKQKQEEFNVTGRDTALKFDDPRMVVKLKRHGLTLNSIPALGARVPLLDNANLSSGGDSVDVTHAVHPGFKEIAVNLTKDMGLRLCGVDLMIATNISQAPGEYWVIEINSAPGLDNYSAIGKKQAKIVEDLYLKVLQAME